MESQNTEVTVEQAAKYLGSTERTIINYLKSHQIEGEKVGKKWFIKKESLLKIRPLNTTVNSTSFPPLENSLSKSQALREKKPWSFKERKKTVLNLRSFASLKELYALLKRDGDLFSKEEFEFFNTTSKEISDALGGGYYSFGPMKKNYYNRARFLSSTMCARSYLWNTTDGFQIACDNLVKSISYLCRNIENRNLEKRNNEHHQ